MYLYSLEALMSGRPYNSWTDDSSVCGGSDEED